MRRNLLFMISLLLTLTEGFAQDWITMTTPQSGVLGAPVSTIKKGDISFNFALKYDKNPGIITRESAESLQEYQDKFRNYVTKYFTSEKVSLQAIKAHNLKVRSLDQETVDKLQVGAKYIYEGIAADSVTITLSTKKENTAEISKALKDISKSITGPQATQIVEKITPFIDSIRFTSGDSVFYKMTINNPNVYYKVKVIKLSKNSNPCKCDWEKVCFLYFLDRDEVSKDFPRTIKLEHDFTGERSSTISRYPEFCGKDRKDIQYALKVEKENDGLHLWVYEQSPNTNNSLAKKIEIPYKDKQTGSNTVREWRLNRTFLNRFEEKGRIKNVFLEVSARQLDDNSLEILNWREGKNSTGDNALTALKYPEFKGKYVKR